MEVVVIKVVKVGIVLLVLVICSNISYCCSTAGAVEVVAVAVPLIISTLLFI